MRKRSALTMSRRAALISGAAIGVGGASVDTEGGIATLIEAWDSQGIHRTATEGDEAGADWLAREAASFGAKRGFEAFTLDRIDPTAAFVEIDGARIPGVPMFDGPMTPRTGVQGLAEKAAPGGQALIGVTELSPLVVYSEQFVTMRRTSQYKALVVATKGGQPGLALLNAEAFRKPYGPVILQVSSEARDAVFAAVGRGAVLRVVAASRRVPATARNLVVEIKGRDAGRAPLVVMTPRSSWWQSTSERAGGIIGWLAVLRALVAAPPANDVVFVASSGHELGHIGLDDFMARRPGWEKTATWMHFGANIGAAGGALDLQSASDDLRELGTGELSRAGRPADTVSPKTLVPNGESREIHRAGGRYVTLVGSNPLFHLPQDRWPHAVSVPDIARIAAAFARLAVVLTR